MEKSLLHHLGFSQGDSDQNSEKEIAFAVKKLNNPP
jgi:hypothetical protein